MMQPKLQRSEAWSYYFSTKETSGARYQREPTWIDMKRIWCLRRGLSFTSWSAINFCFLIGNSFFLTFWFVNFLIIYVLKPFSLVALSGKVLERPRSQILALQSELRRIFADLRSLCMILASWRKLREQREL